MTTTQSTASIRMIARRPADTLGKTIIIRAAAMAAAQNYSAAILWLDCVSIVLRHLASASPSGSSSAAVRALAIASAALRGAMERASAGSVTFEAITRD